MTDDGTMRTPAGWISRNHAGSRQSWRLTGNRLVAYCGHGRGVQGARRSQPAAIAGSAARPQRPDSRRIVRTPRHDATGGLEASRGAGGCQPGRGGQARPREAALPQSGACPRDRRTVDQQGRAQAPAGAERHQEEAGAERMSSELEFVYVTYIATTPEKLWQALTDGAFTSQYWFGTRIESDWRVGSRVSFWRDGALSDSGEVLEYTPPRRLSYTWHVEFHEDFRRQTPSPVTFQLDPPADAVQLTVVHDQFEPGSKVFAAINGGWPKVLASLKSFLETGRGLAVAGCEAAKPAQERAIAEAQRGAASAKARR